MVDFIMTIVNIQLFNGFYTILVLYLTELKSLV